MTEEVKEDKTLEALEPTPRYVERKLGKDGEHRTYLQKPLSFVRKAQLGALVSNLFQRAADQGGPGTINEMIYMGTSLVGDDVTTNEALQEAESFIKLLAAIGSYMPQFITEFYILVLNVPKKDYDFFRKYIEENEEDGGFSDEESIDIFRVFYEQNRERFSELFSLGTGFLKTPVPTENPTEITTTPQAQ